MRQYYVYQRDMWRRDDDWMLVKKGARETDLVEDPAAQA